MQEPQAEAGALERSGGRLPGRSRRRALCLAICAVGVLGVGGLLRPEPARAREAAPGATALGTLVARDHRMRIDLGPLGPIYTLTDLDGEFIDSDTDLARIASRHPTLGLERRLGSQGDGVPLMMVIDDE
ncbi:MAG: hypothetical protein IT439_12435 [Phycisphaerales bacterium]|nr:hypothetical protein [Phycisphaerales bacterium]